MVSSIILEEIKESAQVKNLLLASTSILAAASRAAEVISDGLKNKKKLLIAGNGGSAADAQHIAGELVSRFYYDRPALPAIALTVDTSILTAIGNDYGYEDVFSRQIEALGNSGDIFLAISTSGNSPNILKAARTARLLGLTVIGFTGQRGGQLSVLCDFAICAPSDVTPRIQECHITLGHAICAEIESRLFPRIRESRFPRTESDLLTPSITQQP